jgi:hypothetical protein
MVRTEMSSQPCNAAALSRQLQHSFLRRDRRTVQETNRPMTRQGKGALATLSGRQSPVGRGGSIGALISSSRLVICRCRRSFRRCFRRRRRQKHVISPLVRARRVPCRFGQGCRQGWGWLSVITHHSSLIMAEPHRYRVSLTRVNFYVTYISAVVSPYTAIPS